MATTSSTSRERKGVSFSDSASAKKKPAPPPERSILFSLFPYVLIIILAVCLGVVVPRFQEQARHQKELHGAKLFSLDRLRTTLKREFWDPNQRFALNASVAVPVRKWGAGHSDPSDFLYEVMENAWPHVLTDAPAHEEWTAFKKWKQNDYISSVMPTVKVHAPDHAVIRMHHRDQPFEAEIPSLKWTRPWIETEVNTDVFLNGSKLAYFMRNSRLLPLDLQNDVYPDSMTVEWRQAIERNVWMGSPRATTPTHYDLVHNFYTQIRGQKRFILFPPKDHQKLYLYTRLHPSARQSQVDFASEFNTDGDDSDRRRPIETRFPNFAQAKSYEVILSPGDVLYIPPFWFHHVSVVGDDVSISLSTHSDSDEALLREKIIDLSLKVDMPSFVDSASRESPMSQMAKSLQNGGKSSSSADDRSLWNLARRVNAMYVHVGGLFLSKAEITAALEGLLHSRWSNLEEDVGVKGLWNAIVVATSKFPSVEDLDVEWKRSMNGRVMGSLATVSFDVRDTIDQSNIREHVKALMLLNYLEDTASYYVGAANVLPFLEHVLRDMTENPNPKFRYKEPEEGEKEVETEEEKKEVL
eukprot:TRINITY_DN4265_c0_g1_i2.p1 TRINITY_DN4265_c0_g1~~TRINITY_DN4265_c0_g1_i2.p1  ORF type:complete len:583 (+),score=131.90 TRINITY_DN4265_c0_g1_i2:110-1858(+)